MISRSDMINININVLSKKVGYFNNTKINRRTHVGSIIVNRLNLSDKAKMHLQVLFAQYIADIYVKRLKLAIKQQKYDANWPSLNAKYLRYKEARGLDLGKWIASGKLMRSIKFYKHNGDYIIGIHPANKSGNMSTLHIARILEYGNEHIPARPLFRPIYISITKNVGFYFRKFIRKITGK